VEGKNLRKGGRGGWGVEDVETLKF
jgi:hypothetical protein